MCFTVLCCPILTLNKKCQKHQHQAHQASSLIKHIIIFCATIMVRSGPGFINIVWSRYDPKIDQMSLRLSHTGTSRVTSGYIRHLHRIILIKLLSEGIRMSVIWYFDSCQEVVFTSFKQQYLSRPEPEPENMIQQLDKLSRLIVGAVLEDAVDQLGKMLFCSTFLELHVSLNVT